jgi:hypothetical protein
MPAGRPMEQYPIDVLGSYMVAATSGTIAAGQGANSPVFALQFPGTATGFALVHRISLSLMSLGVGFAAGTATLAAFAARAFTAMDTGGTSLTLTTNNAKRKIGFNTTQTVMMIAGTAALTAGTRTLDAQAMKVLQCAIGTATNTLYLPTTDLFYPDQSGAWPNVLAPGEGMIVQATVPATGTWQLQVNVEWSEVAAY